MTVKSDHNCRAEPHCVCGDNSWYHRDVDDDGAQAAECYQTGCDCKEFRRCREWVNRD